MRYTNFDIVPAAMDGKSAETPNGNFWTKSTPNGILRGGYQAGRLPRRLHDILLTRGDSIVQVIYSYSTPIAWLDAGAWVVPNVRYSVTTSTKHQTHLFKLPGQISIPSDCGVDEYVRNLSGQMTYQPHSNSYAIRHVAS